MPFEGLPMSDDPHALAALTRATPPRGLPRTALFERVDLERLDDGGLRVRHWRVGVVHDPHALGPEAALIAFQRDREPTPTLEHRVITPDGREHRSTAPPAVHERSTHTDTQRLHVVALPALQPGALVETLTVRIERPDGPVGWSGHAPEAGRFVVHAVGLGAWAVEGTHAAPVASGAGMQIALDGAPSTLGRFAAPSALLAPRVSVGATDDWSAVCAAWRALTPAGAPDPAWVARVAAAADPVAEAHQIASQRSSSPSTFCSDQLAGIRASNRSQSASQLHEVGLTVTRCLSRLFVVLVGASKHAPTISMSPS